jgi:nifR3 family TIM-barrel protein
MAPMAGVTSYPFRVFCREFGCALAFTEMADANSIYYESRRTREILSTGLNDRPLGLQLVGRDIFYLSKALEKIDPENYDFIDLNAACPARKIVRKGKGAALLREPKHLSRLLKALKKTGVLPVTLKMRLGFDSGEACVDIAKMAREAGVRALFVHGRTAKQGYSGKPDYLRVKKIKENVDIPVFASGDIFNGPAAGRALDETGCDGVMIARAALGYPWIFREITSFLNDGTTPPKPDPVNMERAIKRHAGLFCSFFGEKPGIVRFRKFYIWYTRGYAGVRALRNRVSSMKTIADAERMTDEFIDVIGKSDIKGELCRVLKK